MRNDHPPHLDHMRSPNKHMLDAAVLFSRSCISQISHAIMQKRCTSQQYLIANCRLSYTGVSLELPLTSKVVRDKEC